jgi:hypothetical protein
LFRGPAQRGISRIWRVDQGFRDRKKKSFKKYGNGDE